MNFTSNFINLYCKSKDIFEEIAIDYNVRNKVDWCDINSKYKCGTFAHTLTHSQTHNAYILTYNLSLSHTLINTRTHALTHIYTRTHSHTRALSHTHTQFFLHTYYLTLTHTHSHALYIEIWNCPLFMHWSKFWMSSFLVASFTGCPGVFNLQVTFRYFL